MADKRDGPVRRFLTAVAHGTTPFISTFILIHLSAPVLANVGGSSLASSTMLLGREYYQTNFGEKALVLVPITAHILSAWLKRVSSSKPATEPRRWQNPLSITGYAVGFLLFPIHYLTHRAYPAQEVAPILEVGPSELDFEFVKLGLQTWPVRSWLIYGTLTIFTTFHMSIGAGILWSTYIRPAFPNLSLPSLKIRNRLALGCIALPTLTGLFFVSREPLMTFSSTAKRYTAALLTSSVYRIGF